MTDGRHRTEAKLVAGGYRGKASSRSHLKAAHVWAVHIRDAEVALVVLRLADGFPLLRFFNSTDD